MCRGQVVWAVDWCWSGIGSRFRFDAYPNPSFHFDADSDPRPHESDANLRPLVYKLSTAPLWAYKPLLWTSAALHSSILSLYSCILTFMRIQIRILLLTIMSIRIWLFTPMRIRLYLNDADQCWSGFTTLANTVRYGTEHADEIDRYLQQYCIISVKKNEMLKNYFYLISIQFAVPTHRTVRYCYRTYCMYSI